MHLFETTNTGNRPLALFCTQNCIVQSLNLLLGCSNGMKPSESHATSIGALHKRIMHYEHEMHRRVTNLKKMFLQHIAHEVALLQLGIL